MSKGISLRGLLLVPFILQIFAAVGVVGYWSFRNGQAAVNDLAQQLMSEVGQRIANRVDDYVSDAKRINDLNADAIQTELLDINDLSELQYRFWQQIQHYPEISFIYWADELGRFAGSIRHEDGNIHVAAAEQGVYERYVADNQGQSSEFLYKLEYDPRERPWYISASETGKPNWSPIFVWSSGSTMSADPVLPVYTPSGELQGVVGVSLGLLDVSKFLSGLTIGKSGEAFIVERSGELVATSTSDLPFVIDEKTQKAARIQADEVSLPLIQEAATYLDATFEGFDQIKTSEQLFLNTGQRRQFVQVLPFQDELGLDWLIIITVPEDDFMAQIYANRRQMILLCIAALVVATLIGIVTAQRITQPVVQLNSSAKAIASGDLNQTVNIGRIQELRVLGQSFNQMAQKLRKSFQALEEVNQELEDRVEERTAEIQKANEEISQLNQKLQSENLRLGAELAVSQKIQQMILPEDTELTQIPELDIVGFMEPADEVGGDYYDVLYQDGAVKIGIGDVTGHGLESGLVMLMAQTAIRTLQIHNEKDPVRFLDTLNRTLYSNVQRMKSDKNLTLALLDYEAGKLRIIGQHEDIILVRANGKIERINTVDLGFPLALVEDVRNFIDKTHISLDSGDVVLLYTDGITEARNAARSQYGVDRLCLLVQQNVHCSALEIRQAVIADVQRHIAGQKLHDDLTLVVLKHK